MYQTHDEYILNYDNTNRNKKKKNNNNISETKCNFLHLSA